MLGARDVDWPSSLAEVTNQNSASRAKCATIRPFLNYATCWASWILIGLSQVNPQQTMTHSSPSAAAYSRPTVGYSKNLAYARCDQKSIFDLFRLSLVGSQ